MNSITEFVQKRDKKKIAKMLFVVLALVSFYTNYSLAKQVYNLRCDVGGQVIGWMVKDITCGELADAKMELIELDRQLRVQDAYASEFEE